jgi:hypothetical protein
VLALLGCILVAGIVAFAWLSRSAITRENAARVEEGMTLAEVEALLGPERDVSSGDLYLDPSMVPDGYEVPMDAKLAYRRWETWLLQEGVKVRVWASDQVIVRLEFGTDGRVRSRKIWPVWVAPEGFVEKVRRWLNL